MPDEKVVNTATGRKILLKRAQEKNLFIRDGYAATSEKELDEYLSKRPINTEKVAKREKIPKSLMEKVWTQYCGPVFKAPCMCNNMMTVFHFEVCHKISVAKGGSTTLENLYPACSLCNRSMGTMELEEFAKKYYPNAILYRLAKQPPYIPRKAPPPPPTPPKKPSKICCLL